MLFISSGDWDITLRAKSLCRRLFIRLIFIRGCIESISEAESDRLPCPPRQECPYNWQEAPENKTSVFCYWLVHNLKELLTNTNHWLPLQKQKRWRQRELMPTKLCNTWFDCRISLDCFFFLKDVNWRSQSKEWGQTESAFDLYIISLWWWLKRIEQKMS